jgi:hypothetical protein
MNDLAVFDCLGKARNTNRIQVLLNERQQRLLELAIFKLTFVHSRKIHETTFAFNPLISLLGVDYEYIFLVEETDLRDPSFQRQTVQWVFAPFHYRLGFLPSILYSNLGQTSSILLLVGQSWASQGSCSLLALQDLAPYVG